MLPYYLSGFSILIASLSFLNQCSSDTTEKTSINKELPISDTLQDKSLSIKVIDKEIYKDTLEIN